MKASKAEIAVFAAIVVSAVLIVIFWGWLWS